MTDSESSDFQVIKIRPKKQKQASKQNWQVVYLHFRSLVFSRCMMHFSSCWPMLVTYIFQSVLDVCLYFSDNYWMFQTVIRQGLIAQKRGYTMTSWFAVDYRRLECRRVKWTGDVPSRLIQMLQSINPILNCRIRQGVHTDVKKIIISIIRSDWCIVVH